MASATGLEPVTSELAFTLSPRSFRLTAGPCDQLRHAGGKIRKRDRPPELPFERSVPVMRWLRFFHVPPTFRADCHRLLHLVDWEPGRDCPGFHSWESRPFSTCEVARSRRMFAVGK